MRIYNPNVSGILRDKGGTEYNVVAFGARGDGISDDAPPIQAALNAAAASLAQGTFGARIAIPAGNFLCRSALTWPANVSIVGAGITSTTLRFDGAHNGIEALDAGPAYAFSGELRDLQIVGQNGALVGVWVTFRQRVDLRRVFVSFFARQGVIYDNTIMTSLDHCQLGSNGDATRAQVEIDHSVSFLWTHTYISGSGANCIAGLAIDRSGPIAMRGGAIESTGIPIRLCGKAEAVSGVGPGVIDSIDLENPNNGAVTWIEMGAGWAGAAGAAVQRVTFLGVTASPSGSATVANGVRATSTGQIHFGQCSFGVPAPAQGVSIFELLGVGNLRWSLGVQGGSLSAGLAYVRANAVARPDARPDQPWEQIGRQLVMSVLALPNGATPAVDGYSYCRVANPGAQNITNITGGVDGQVLFIEAGNGNNTLVHAAGGAGAIFMRAGANLLLVAGRTYGFTYSAANGVWVQTM